MHRCSLIAAIVGGTAALTLAACGNAHTGYGDAPGSGAGDGGATTGEDASGNLFGDSAAQGDVSTTCAATTTSAKKATVDILFVIDDSGSMTEEMAQIKTNVNTFATKIGQSGLDYRVIFIVKRGTVGNTIRVPPPLAQAACADNPPNFYHVNIDVQSHNSLALILSSYDTTWKDYVRPDAYKVFVEVSDDQATRVLATQFDTKLLAKPPAEMFGTAANRKYIFDSIVGWTAGTPLLTGAPCSTAVNNGSEYQKLSQLTGGIVDSVCKTDYSGVLDNLAKGLVTRLGCEFAMPTPDGGTVDPEKVVVQFSPSNGPAKTLVQVTDAAKCGAVADAWYYDDNANPTKLLLCPTTCTTVGAEATGSVAVLLGCKGAVAK